MKLLTVKMHGRTGDDSDFVLLDLLEEVNAIDLWDRTKNSGSVLAFHTARGSYLALTTLSDIAKAWSQYGFELIGKDIVINQNRVDSIKAIDNNGSVVTFVDGMHCNVKKQI